MGLGTLSAATSGRDAGKPCRLSRDRLYLNVGIGLRIAGEKTRPRAVRVMGWIVARSGFGWLMRYDAPGQAGRGSDLYPRLPGP